MKFSHLLSTTILFCGLAFASMPMTAAYGQTIPSAADSSRIENSPEKMLPPEETSRIPSIQTPSKQPLSVPDGVEGIETILNSVIIAGSTVFSNADLSSIYEDFIGKKIPISLFWQFASDITQKYQDAGYFLSRAYIPAQEIDGGVLRIQIAEGSITDVAYEGQYTENSVINAIKREIIENRPAQLSKLESALLKLNDIPGLNYEALLDRGDQGGSTEGKENSIRLTLQETPTTGRGSVFFNNYGSSYLGPVRATAVYEDSFAPFHNTSISGIRSIPSTNEVASLAITHEIYVYPGIFVDLSASRTLSEPGEDLAALDVRSNTTNLSAGIKWNAIRQRIENATVGLKFDATNVASDILDTPFTRDHIRAIRLNMGYENYDGLNGFNSIEIESSQGLRIAGASNPGDLNISRSTAEPDFFKSTLNWTRIQRLSQNWMAQTVVSGQYSADALYSSEEIGFGGQSIGRAYDSSEITGDKGVGGGVEFRYMGVEPYNAMTFTPNLFYDIGKVWNNDPGAPNEPSVASAGIGMGIAHPSGFNAAFSIAQPLTKTINDPIQSSNDRKPRFSFQMGWSF